MPIYRLAELLSRMYTQTLAPHPDPTHLQHSPLSKANRSHLINTIGTWAFDPHSLSEDEVFACVCLIFELVFTIDGMTEDIRIQSPEQLLPFLLAIRSIYDQQNAYHNYHHALDVLQAMYVFLVSAGCIPPITILEDLSNPRRPSWKRDANTPGRIKELLSNIDVFTLFVAAIGHDVGHPGLNNAFMVSPTPTHAATTRCHGAETPCRTFSDERFNAPCVIIQSYVGLGANALYLTTSTHAKFRTGSLDQRQPTRQ